jgi:hypothetical protein
MPAPLRIFFFIFFIVFFGGTLMGWTLGLMYTCDTQGLAAYDVGYFDRVSIEKGVALGYQQCVGNSTNFVGDLFADWFTWGITKDIVRGTTRVDCEAYVNSSSSAMFDSYLQKYGSPVSNKEGIGMTCVYDEKEQGYYPSLGFYGQNMLDKNMWLLASVLVLLMPLAFYWYMIVLR